MQYHELSAQKKKSSKRVGRGIAAGQGKTAGRGTKGQSSRTGGRRSPGFEGGQTPLMMRLPKLRGFKSHKPRMQNVYTGQLNGLKGEVNVFSLYDAGLIASPYDNVKLVTKGELTTAVTVHLQGASASAIKAVEKAGGSFTQIPRVARAKKEDTAK